MKRALLAICAVGCGGDGSAPMVHLPPLPDGGSLPGITGTANDRFVTETGTRSDTVDLSGASPSATTAVFVYPGTGKADGTFAVALVPPSATYTLKGIGPALTTRARDLELGFTYLGRVDQIPATMPTRLAISATGMDPWATGDVLEVYSSGADAIAFGQSGNGSFVAGEPASGATSLSGATLDWLAQGAGLIEASKGDTAIVLHVHQATAGGTAYLAATSAFTTSSLDQTDGANASITGTFAALATASDTLDWRRSQFAAHLPETGEQTDGGMFVEVLAQPQAATAGWPSGSEFVAPDLMDLFAAAGTTADATIGPLTYGDPTPSLDKIGVFGTSTTRGYTLPGTTVPFKLRAGMVGVVLHDALVAGPIQPLVTPPLSLEADGASVMTDTTLARATPTLTWTAPAVGTPGVYAVSVWQLNTGGSATTASPAFRTVTVDTRLAIPSGALVSGRRYVVRVTARVSSGDLSRAPLSFALPYGEADVASGILTVP